MPDLDHAMDDRASAFLAQLRTADVETLEHVADSALTCLAAVDWVFQTRFPDRHAAWGARVQQERREAEEARRHGGVGEVRE